MSNYRTLMILLTLLAFCSVIYAQDDIDCPQVLRGLEDAEVNNLSWIEEGHSVSLSMGG